MCAALFSCIPFYCTTQKLKSRNTGVSLPPTFLQPLRNRSKDRKLHSFGANFFTWGHAIWTAGTNFVGGKRHKCQNDHLTSKRSSAGRWGAVAQIHALNRQTYTNRVFARQDSSFLAYFVREFADQRLKRLPRFTRFGLCRLLQKDPTSRPTGPFCARQG